MENNKKILIVEDDPGLQKQMKWSFEDFEVFIAGNRQEALKVLTKERPPVVTVDLGLPPDPEGFTEGIATVEEILAKAPHTKVIVVSGNDDRANAVQAVASGAYDFYQKPIDAELLNQIITRAHHVYELEEENRRLIMERPSGFIEGMIASSPQMEVVCQ
ncbi:Response regulatory protein, partial [hydrothermal vent metagenome]